MTEKTYIGSYNIGQKCFHIETIEEMEKKNKKNILGALDAQDVRSWLWIPFCYGTFQEVDEKVSEFEKLLWEKGKQEGDKFKYLNKELLELSL